ncbi:hypothetical protein [Filifactor alocis]
MFKVYLKTLLISIICIGLPILDFFYFQLLSDEVVFFIIGMPVIGLIISWLYILKHIDSTKNRVVVFLLNPVIYLWVSIVMWMYLFVKSTSENGFYPGNF